MNSVERVKAICKERKIAISRLEKDLGYANGYIGQLRKGVLPDDRLVEIASYFGVTVGYLLGTEKEKTPTSEGERKISDSDLMFGLWGNSDEVDEDDLADVKRYAAFVRERKRERGK